MRSDYRQWLADQGYVEGTCATQYSRALRIEEYYGSLDNLEGSAGFDALIDELTYSTEDERRGRSNPSPIPINGSLHKSLASYKSAVALYRKFLSEPTDLPGVAQSSSFADAPADPASSSDGPAAAEKQRLSLERDMQAELRRDIARLETGLRIIDDGSERYVASGFIDILCRDGAGQVVVVELKAGKTDAKVIGQTLGYMGDLMEEDALQTVRGIIVAHAFDQRTLSAARAVTGLKLYTYAVTFQFQPVQQV